MAIIAPIVSPAARLQFGEPCLDIIPLDCLGRVSQHTVRAPRPRGRRHVQVQREGSFVAPVPVVAVA
jgi:hypothetical protein